MIIWLICPHMDEICARNIGEHKAYDCYSIDHTYYCCRWASIDHTYYCCRWAFGLNVRVTGPIPVWRCHKSRSGCPARIEVRQGLYRLVNPDHNHDPREGAVAHFQAKADFRGVVNAKVRLRKILWNLMKFFSHFRRDKFFASYFYLCKYIPIGLFCTHDEIG